MNINIIPGKNQTVNCDNSGKEIRKYHARRIRRKLEGKKNFCCNDCKFSYWKKYGSRK